MNKVIEYHNALASKMQYYFSILEMIESDEMSPEAERKTISIVMQKIRDVAAELEVLKWEYSGQKTNYEQLLRSGIIDQQ